jgi:glycine/D-amino acid oxidase-like deaminating enzyme
VTVNVKMDPRLRGDDDTPSMNVDDLGAGAHTPHDGWCDPNGLLWGFRRKAVELGAVYLKDRVVAAEMDGALATLRTQGVNHVSGFTCK